MMEIKISFDEKNVKKFIIWWEKYEGIYHLMRKILKHLSFDEKNLKKSIIWWEKYNEIDEDENVSTHEYKSMKICFLWE